MTDYHLITAERISEMTRAERATYYMALYQKAGAVVPMMLLPDELALPGYDESPGEALVYSAAGNALVALLDTLMALTEMLEVEA